MHRFKSLIRVSLIVGLVAVIGSGQLLAQSNVPCSLFTPAQQALMQEGERLDPTKPWQLSTFLQDAGSRFTEAKPVEVGERSHIVAREVIVRAGLDVMITFELIQSYVIMALPAAFQPGDPWVYPNAPCPAPKP